MRNPHEKTIVLVSLSYRRIEHMTKRIEGLFEGLRFV